MAQRSSLKDILDAVAIISGIVAIGDMVARGKSAAEANARHDRTKAKLDAIEKGMAEINARLRAK